MQGDPAAEKELAMRSIWVRFGCADRVGHGCGFFDQTKHGGDPRRRLWNATTMKPEIAKPATADQVNASHAGRNRIAAGTGATPKVQNLASGTELFQRWPTEL
jgi:hypothetical protein